MSDPQSPLRIAARLDPSSVETLEVLQRLSGERNLTRLIKRALEAYRRELEGGGEPALPPPEAAPAAAQAKPAAGIDAATGVRVATLPFDPVQGRFDDEALQRLLAGRTLRSCSPVFFQQDGRSYWSVWLQYAEPAGTQAAAQRELSGADRILYQALRDWRREAAEAAKVPVFVVATNRQLLAVVEAKPRSLQALGQLAGFGKKKLARYGAAIVATVSAVPAGGESGA
jgi:hypothetical protein